MDEGVDMEYIPGYDAWKTTPPEPPEPDRRCAICDAALYEGDAFYDIDGGICKACLDDEYKRFV